MVRSLGFGSYANCLSLYSNLVSLRLPESNSVKPAVNENSPARSPKSTRSLAHSARMSNFQNSNIQKLPFFGYSNIRTFEHSCAMHKLSLFVSKWFQVTISLPSRGTFHLSLTVLVHYRSARVFSLGGVVPPDSPRLCRSYLGIRLNNSRFRIRVFHPLWKLIPKFSAS